MSDDDIEIVEMVVGKSCVNNDLCQVCSTSLSGLSSAARKEHYDEHGSGKSTNSSRSKRGRRKSTSVTASGGKTSPITMKLPKTTKKVEQEDLFWYPAQATTPPPNYSPGLLSILKGALKKFHTKGAIKRAVLCYERTPHIYRETFDTNWGCGYRNFMMACAALMDQQDQSLYNSNLIDPSPPGVANLQRWIEEAWGRGYDNSGADEFDHKLVATKKKIGTGDLYVAFTSRRIPCVLLDFDLKNSPKGFDTLIDWVVNYFTEKPEGNIHTILRAASPVTASRKMPIIMQWEGHSVTIVGFELGKNGKHNLFVFDPSSKIADDIRQAALGMPVSAASSSTFPGKSKYRERSKSPVAKRPRTDQDPEDVVSISDSDDEKINDARQAMAIEPTVNPDKLIKSFRLKPGHMKKQVYQLLYFTMGNLLSDEEQNNRKIVLSELVC